MDLPLSVLEQRLKEEIINRSLAGYITDGMAERLINANGSRSALLALHEALKSLPCREDWPYVEPSGLLEIQNERPPEPDLPAFYLNETEVLNKIYGGWSGRAAGCILGKPLEVGWDHRQIHDYLEKAGALPLNDFIPSQSRSGEVLRRDCVPSMRGYIQYAQEDDDLNYMCLAVKLLETYGLSFSTLDVGMNWLSSIPFLWTWGPEHVVYLNLATAIGEHRPGQIDLESVTGYLNPGVEFIGAQIRSDVFGYICPGLPEKAAALAWRDAYLTHRRNGLYGSMWIAAMNAAAFTLLDAEAVILAGLAQIPARSRFTEAIHQTIAWCRADDDWCVTAQRIRDHYDVYTFAGAINNACCVAASLLYGWGDGSGDASKAYEKTITTAVQMGYDTDCNGASAGSVVGIMSGGSLLPQKWTAPLNDTLRTCVAEFGQVTISEMAQRTHVLSRILRSAG